MKFLLDMGLARTTAAFLRGQGHDAIHLREQGLQRMADYEVLDKAQAEGRVILTHDLDFSRIVALSRSRLPSIVTFRLSDMRPVRVNYYLTEVLGRFESELRNGALISVNERGIRVRLLPIDTTRS